MNTRDISCFVYCILFVLVGGCQAVRHPSTQTVSAQSRAGTFVEVVPLPVYNCHWMSGEYTNFVVVTTTNLALPLTQWTTWLETDKTNFQFVVDEPQRFFTLYGTNKVTSESAWAGT